MKRPFGVTVVAVLMCIGAGLLALGSLAFFVLGAACSHRFHRSGLTIRGNWDSSLVAASGNYGIRLAAFCDHS
jgi:hypothetical protein